MKTKHNSHKLIDRVDSRALNECNNKSDKKNLA